MRNAAIYCGIASALMARAPRCCVAELRVARSVDSRSDLRAQVDLRSIVVRAVLVRLLASNGE